MTPDERERAGFDEAFANFYRNEKLQTDSFRDGCFRAYIAGMKAARREELDRTREYLRKLAWSDADILAWENWRGK